jgi:hypothetical protein
MKTTFDHKTHIGTVDGEVWPSVTQLLTENRLHDLSRVPDERLEYKRILGTRVHAAAVLLENRTLDETHFNESFPDCIPYLNAYRKFREIEPFESVVNGQMRLFSKKWRFHGESDFIGIHSEKYAGHLCVIDYKCTWGMYPSVGPQTAGYEILNIENAKELGIPNELIKRKVLRFALILKATENYDLIPLTDVNDKQDFLACLWLHWQRRNKYKTQKGV